MGKYKLDDLTDLVPILRQKNSPPFWMKLRQRRSVTMSEKRILITENDLRRLRPLVEAARSGESDEKRNADRLKNKLARAKAVGSRQIPENLVTMNSWIQLLHLDSSEKTECWLRFPAEEGSPPRAVSILTDLGIALLGSREGDVIEWLGPSGKRKSKVAEIMYQPERMGNTEL